MEDDAGLRCGDGVAAGAAGGFSTDGHLHLRGEPRPGENGRGENREATAGSGRNPGDRASRGSGGGGGGGRAAGSAVWSGADAGVVGRSSKASVVKMGALQRSARAIESEGRASTC